MTSHHEVLYLPKPTPTALGPIYLLFSKTEYLSDLYCFLFLVRLPLYICPHLDVWRFLSASFLSISNTHSAPGWFSDHSRPVLMTHGRIVCLRMHEYVCVSVCMCIWLAAKENRFAKSWYFSILATTFAVVKDPSISHGANGDFFNFSSAFLTARFHCKSFSVKPSP